MASELLQMARKNPPTHFIFLKKQPLTRSKKLAAEDISLAAFCFLAILTYFYSLIQNDGNTDDTD